MLRYVAVFGCVCALLAVETPAKSLSAKALRSARGFSWISDRSENFDYFFEAGTPAARDIEKIKERMEASRARVEKLLGTVPGPRIPAFIVDSRARMKELAGFETNGLATGSVSLMVYNDTINAVGAHEMCHVRAYMLWGKSHGTWVNEGLAVYSDDQWWGVPLHPVARGLLDRGKLIPLKDLVAEGWHKKYPDLDTYPELGSFVKFVYEKYGLPAVRTLWQHGASGAGAAFGKPLSEVEAEWRLELARIEPGFPRYKILGGSLL